MRGFGFPLDPLAALDFKTSTGYIPTYLPPPPHAGHVGIPIHPPPSCTVYLSGSAPPQSLAAPPTTWGKYAGT
eukprot:4768302-Pyramimonas_sp.AAC.1